MSKQNAQDLRKQGLDLIAPHVDNIEKALFDPDGIAMCYMGAWLGSTIMTQQKHEIEWVNLGYDCSSYPKKTDKIFDLTKYKTVYDFLDNESNGETIATHESGYGMRSGTFSDDFNSVACDAWMLSLEKNFPEIYQMNIDFADNDMDQIQWYDDIYDAFCHFNIADDDLEQFFNELPLMKTFLKYFPQAIEKIKADEEAEEKIKLLAQERLDFLTNLAQSFPEELQLFCKGKSFDKSNWIVLLDFLNQHDIKKVGATLRLIHISTSNSVHSKLLQLYPTKP